MEKMKKSKSGKKEDFDGNKKLETVCILIRNTPALKGLCSKRMCGSADVATGKRRIKPADAKCGCGRNNMVTYSQML